MTDKEIQSAIDDIADVLDNGVSLDDLTGHLIAYSAQHGQADDARVRALLDREAPAEVRAWEAQHGTATAVEPMLITANPDLHMVARICVPLIHRGVRTGLLFVLAPGATPSKETIRERVSKIADQLDLLATVLYEMASPHLDERHQHELEFYAACLGQQNGLAAIAGWNGVRAASAMRVAVSIFTGEDGVTPFSESRAAQLRLSTQQAVSRFPSAIASCVRDTHSIVLLRPDREANPALTIHQRLAVVSGDERARLYTGVADTVHGIDSLPVAYERAVAAAQAAAVEPESGTLASWTNIGHYRVLSTHLRADSPDTVSEALDTLIAADTTGDLVTTLEVYYDQGDNVQAVADALHLHRSSLYYRLGKIRDIIGVDPLAGSTRLELHLALKLARWQRRPRI